MADALLGEIDEPDEFKSSELVKLDQSLRCPICSELFKGAVLLQCLHSFCSCCIRDALSVKVPPRCPVCSAESDQGRIRTNPALDDAVRFWRQARPRILELDTQPAPPSRPTRGRSNLARASPAVAGGSLQLDSSDDEMPRPFPQSPRSHSTSTKVKPTSSDPARKEVPIGPHGSSDVEIMDDATPNRPAKRVKVENSDPSDPKARVACPMCETVMAQAKVFDHIQTCDGKKKDSPASSSNAGWAGFMSSTQAGRTAPLPSSKLLARRSDDGRPVHLPLISYTSLNLKTLKAKLEELGLLTTTPPAAKTANDKVDVYKRRHREFTLRWNSNCDVHPHDNRHKSEAQIKEDLRQWEVRQDKSEKFDIGDKKDWVRTNADQFRALSAQARATARAARQANEGGSDPAGGENSTETISKITTTFHLASDDLDTADDATANLAAASLVGDTPAPTSAPPAITSAFKSSQPSDAPPARRSTRTRTVAFADVPVDDEQPPRARRAVPLAVADEEDSDSMDEEGQLKMPRPSQRVREEEELWQRREAEAAEGTDEDDESSGTEDGVVPLAELESECESEGGLV